MKTIKNKRIMKKFDYKKKSILISAGGTGGHIFPAIATAKCLMNCNYRVVFLTDSNFDKFKPFLSDVLSRINFSVEYLSIKRRRGFFGRLLMLIESIIAIIPTIRIILKRKVSCVVGFGGYSSLAPVLAGFLSFRKVAVHEQNAYMGVANRISIFFSSICMSGFRVVEGCPSLCKNRVVFTGNPIREKVKNLCYEHDQKMNINYDIFFKIYRSINILVVGGSQGAAIFSSVIPDAIVSLPLSRRELVNVYHQAPKKDVEKLRLFYANNGIRAVVLPFFQNIGELMSSSHIMISRSGAGTLSELACLGVPAILIPYPHSANNHQFKNGIFFKKAGASVLIEETDLTQSKLRDTIVLLLDKDESLKHMSRAAREISEPNADVKVAVAIETLIMGRLISNFNSVKFDTSKFISYFICIA